MHQIKSYTKDCTVRYIYTFSVEPSEKKTVVSRATSPQPDWSKGVRTRIAKNSDPIYVEKRRPRQPRAYEVACQTDPNSEFGLLADYLQAVRPFVSVFEYGELNSEVEGTHQALYIDRVPYFSNLTKTPFSHILQIWQL